MRIRALDSSSGDGRKKTSAKENAEYCKILNSVRDLNGSETRSKCVLNSSGDVVSSRHFFVVEVQEPSMEIVNNFTTSKILNQGIFDLLLNICGHC